MELREPDFVYLVWQDVLGVDADLLEVIFELPDFCVCRRNQKYVHGRVFKWWWSMVREYFPT